MLPNFYIIYLKKKDKDTPKIREIFVMNPPNSLSNEINCAVQSGVLPDYPGHGLLRDQQGLQALQGAQSRLVSLTISFQTAQRFL